MNDSVDLLPGFNPVTDLPENFLVIMYGLRRSGKTVLMKYLLSQMEERLKHTEIYVICGTLDVNPGQYDFIPKSAQFSDVENLDYRLKLIVDKQKADMKNFREKKGKIDFKKKYEHASESEASEDECPTPLKHTSKSRVAAKREIIDSDQYKDCDVKPVLLILDDVVSENAVRTSSYLRLLAIGGRHIMISCIILSQVVAGSASVPPSVRTQADTIIVVANPRSRVERELIAEQYLCAGNESNAKSIGLNLLSKTTEVEHRALVISTCAPNARAYPDYCFKVGPCPYPPTPDGWKLGTDEQWSYQRKAKKPKSKELPNPLRRHTELPMDMKTGDYLRGIEDEVFW